MTNLCGDVRDAVAVERSVSLRYTEYWGTYVSLAFRSAEPDDAVLAMVDRVAMPHGKPANRVEAEMRRELLGENRTLCYGDKVRLGSTVYELTDSGWVSG